VDTSETPKRKWYRKKRWWAALLAVGLAYPLSAGPFMWAWLNGYVPPETLACYRPVVKGEHGPRTWPGVGPYYAGYLDWWALLGSDRASPD